MIVGRGLRRQILHNRPHHAAVRDKPNPLSMHLKKKSFALIVEKRGFSQVNILGRGPQGLHLVPAPPEFLNPRADQPSRQGQAGSVWNRDRGDFQHSVAAPSLLPDVPPHRLTPSMRPAVPTAFKRTSLGPSALHGSGRARRQGDITNMGHRPLPADSKAAPQPPVHRPLARTRDQ